MVWEWSHSTEAYAAVQQNIHVQTRDWLAVVYAEWKAAIPHQRFGIIQSPAGFKNSNIY